MKSFGYYAYPDPGTRGGAMDACSLASDVAPLIVNCAGNFHSQFPFTTDNTSGRLDYYLMHITAGKLTVHLDDGTHTVSAGHTILFPPHYPYRYTYDGCGETLNYLWAHFTGSHADFYLRELGFDPLPCIKQASGETHAMMHFERLFDLFPKEDPFRTHALGAALQEILLALARANCRPEEQNLIIRSLRYINASYTAEIRIPDLAAMENLSHSRYNVLFRAATGTSPRQYIINLRMRHACELLRGTDMPIKQVGILVGYHDPHFFSKIFKSNLGTSPQSYRDGDAGTG